jgi:amino acid permease
MGWTYAISWLLTLYAKPAPKNMSTCETFLTKLQTIRDHCSQFNHPVLEHLFVSIFLVVLIIIQVFGVRGYGEG